MEVRTTRAERRFLPDRRLASAFKRVSWGAILAGVVTVLAIQILLGTLGIGIGAAVADPEVRGGLSGLGTGSAIWFVVSALIALFVGGCVAGRLAGVNDRNDGMLHGFVTWGFATLLLFYMLTTTVGGVIGGAASILGQTLSTTAQTAVSNSNQPRQRGEISYTTLASDPEIMQQAKDAFSDGQLTPTERSSLVGTIAQKEGISQQVAEDRLAEFERTYQSAQQQLGQLRQEVDRNVNAEAAADTVSAAAWATFFMLLLGAGAATIGGMMGTSRELVVMRHQHSAVATD